MNNFICIKAKIFNIYLLFVYLLDIFVNFIIVSKIIVKYKNYIFSEALVIACGEKFPIIAICFIMFISLIYSIAVAYMLLALCNNKNISIPIATALLVKNIIFIMLRQYLN